MMPLVTLWPFRSTEKLMEECRRYMLTAGFGADVYRAEGPEASSPENLAATLSAIHREMLDLKVADPTLHLIVMVPLTSPDALRWVDEAIAAIAPLKYHVTFDLLGFQQAAMAVTDPEAAGSADNSGITGRISGLVTAVESAPFRGTVSVIDDYVASGASAGFTLPMLGELLGIFLEVMAENYGEILSPALLSAVKGKMKILSFGLSEVKFDREEVTGRLVHRSFVAALEKAGLKEGYVNSQAVAHRAHTTLDGIEGFYDRFYNAYICDELRKNRDEGQLAAALVEPLKAEAEELERKLTAFMADNSLSLPEKEATLAMMLGRDNKRLRGNLYKQAVRLYDDVFTRPVKLFVEAFNTSAADSGLLPVRGEYATLKIPEPMDDDGTIHENPLNKVAFNPLPLIKELKSDILDLTAYIRDKEEEIASLQLSLNNEYMASGKLTEQGFLHADGDSSAEVVKQPLPKLESIRKALSEAKDRMAASMAKYEDAYRYYHDLLAKLELPYVRDELRRCAEGVAAGKVTAVRVMQSQLISEKPGKLQEFCHRYRKQCWTMTLALGVSAVIGGMVYYFGGSMGAWWWIAMAVGILLNIGQWLHYRYARRRRDRELKEEIDSCSLRLEHLERDLLEKQLCFHAAGMVIDECSRLSRRLENFCRRLESFNGNLECWYEEDYRKIAMPLSGKETMFMTLTDPARIDALFERNVERIIAGIDFGEAFRDYNLTEESMAAVRRQLEEVSRKAIAELIESFSMEDYLQRLESYSYVPEPDINRLAQRLNHMAQILTRHNACDATCESQFVMAKVDSLQAFRNLVAPCFSFPPLVLGARSRDTLVLLTLRTLSPSDLII